MKTSLYASLGACRELIGLPSETPLSCIQESRDRRDTTDSNRNLPNDFGKS
jgi:hypothetical protein